jgi:hypothetical protein
LIQHEHGTGYKLTFPLNMEHTIEGWTKVEHIKI